MKGTIQTLEVSYIMHATEDVERVNSAVSELVGAAAPPEVEEMTGHFGNLIRKVTLRSHGAEAAESFARLAKRLPPQLKAELVKDLDLFLDEHSALFLRLDKQKLIQGEAQGIREGGSQGYLQKPVGRELVRPRGTCSSSRAGH